MYRCLEATYAFTRASELAVNLGVTDRSWFEIAKALGESLNWYPRHDQSLASVMSLTAVDPDDIRALAVSLGKNPDGTDVAAHVATGMRELRNSLVHYGPTTRAVAVPDGDWNRLCTPLARIVGSVFAHTYGGGGTRPSMPDVSESALISHTLKPNRSLIRRHVNNLARLVRVIYSKTP